MIDFVGKRKLFITLSLLLILASLIFVFTKGFNLGVDFAGGTEFVISADKELKIDEIRNVLTDINSNYATAKIVKLKNLNVENASLFQYSIVLKESLSGSTALKENLIKTMKNSFKEKGITIDFLEFNDVSGYAAEEIKSYAWYAVIISLVLLLAYITLRFKFSFGVGAIIALAHDIIITLGFYSLFGIEINVAAIAAFLTLAGYSLNDTIVVYDKIRENMKKLRGKKDIEEIVNISINEVIVRSLNTSITTFLVVLPILLWGGKAIAPFAFGLAIGVIVGTYSSLYIASPIVINWIKKSKVY
ncbi:preprotein translocase subunit SecF [Marinitoga sp. 1135]|uniref:Protein-export membrane protein SecF n=1 Tax=Marinitoga piezophila (strain DSM 14283 / JCM 11233 / KA3) TaxID=443254 RepID=H2J5X0_MARPK|nr:MULTISPECIES: protein translocase subunit SecF [Marinitoga]AEX86189.1 protein-export membrane protein, SecD/SecF family [Marinitoga piezophila KA3]APT76603.1 preprotein translocase subunit SecF [Marinitoga sp. 1137]NUU96377.1 preprotein translocase subunit SecF [Marinitoga sp. 1135]NUU98299.1 preprotein translocase subunit SecF [Marinitoga sp. 1138]